MHQRTLSSEWNDSLQNKIKYWQIINQISCWYTAYIRRVYNSTIKLNNQVQNLAKDLNKYFSKDDTHIKRCSTTLATKETQTEATIW
jgi:hypothetical protein